MREAGRSTLGARKKLKTASVNNKKRPHARPCVSARAPRSSDKRNLPRRLPVARCKVTHFRPIRRSCAPPKTGPADFGTATAGFFAKADKV